MRLALIALSLVLATPVAAESPFPNGTYVGLFGSASGLIEKGEVTGPLAGISFGFGRDFGPVEVEIAQRERLAPSLSGGGQGDQSTTTFMVNGYYYFGEMSGGRVKPYVGGGIGIATDLDVPGGTAVDSTVIAAQTMIGMEYSLGGAASLTGEIRYFATDKFTADVGLGTVETSIDGVDAIVGLRLRF